MLVVLGAELNPRGLFGIGIGLQRIGRNQNGRATC